MNTFFCLQSIPVDSDVVCQLVGLLVSQSVTIECMLYLYSKSKLPYIFSKRREDRGLVFNILESQTFHFELGWANIEIIRAGKFLYQYQEYLDPGPKSNIFYIY